MSNYYLLPTDVVAIDFNFVFRFK